MATAMRPAGLSGLTMDFSDLMVSGSDGVSSLLSDTLAANGRLNPGVMAYDLRVEGGGSHPVVATGSRGLLLLSQTSPLQESVSHRTARALGIPGESVYVHNALGGPLLSIDSAVIGGLTLLDLEATLGLLNQTVVHGPHILVAADSIPVINELLASGDLEKVKEALVLIEALPHDDWVPAIEKAFTDFPGATQEAFRALNIIASDEAARVIWEALDSALVNLTQRQRPRRRRQRG